MAFFSPKTQENAEKVPLTEDLNRLAKGLPQRPGLGEAIRVLAKHYGFIHIWPGVFQSGRAKWMLVGAKSGSAARREGAMNW